MAAEIKAFWQGGRIAGEFSATIQSPLLVGHWLKSASSSEEVEVPALRQLLGAPSAALLGKITSDAHCKLFRRRRFGVGSVRLCCGVEAGPAVLRGGRGLPEGHDPCSAQASACPGLPLFCLVSWAITLPRGCRRAAAQAGAATWNRAACGSASHQLSFFYFHLLACSTNDFCYFCYLSM